jgi:flavin-dependent dehydrogenase
MSRKRTLVLGCGVAGLTVAQLLSGRGWTVDCLAGTPGPGPVVVIGWPDALLLLELWQADEALFRSAHRLHGRVVHWEPGPAPSLAPAPALVMPIDRLTRVLADRAGAAGMRFVDTAQVDATDYDWVVQAGGRPAMAQASIDFGRRCGAAAPVRLAPCAHTDRTVMESVADGWLFVIPHGLGRGTLQAVFCGPRGDPAADLQALLSQSRAASALVEEIAGRPIGFAAMPRLATTPCVSGSIAVGDAALTLDPMSGGGIASGLRGAILAAAVLDATEGEGTSPACFEHYAQRLRDVMRSHVRSCIELYGRAVNAMAWRAEIRAMVEALQRLPTASAAPAFMLNHGRLDRVAHAN